MTVSAGVGGGGVVGVTLGGGMVSGGGLSAPVRAADVVRELPFTGATHLMLMLTIALVLLVAGTLAVGLARRAADGPAPEPA